MTAKVAFTLEADPQRVIAAITKLEEKVGSLEAKNRQLRMESARAAKEGEQGLLRQANAAEKAATSVAAAAGAFLGFSGALSILDAVESRLSAIAKKSADMGKASKDLASQVSSPEVVRGVKQQAAGMGVKPSEAVEYAGTLTALFGEKGMQKAMPAANKLKRMDVGIEDISAIGTAASANKLDFTTAASAFGVAATESALPPRDLAKAAPSWMEYKDARTGMAASAALAAGGVAPGSLMDRTKDLSLGLKMDSDLKKKAEKAAGGANEYASLSEIEQLAIMRSLIPDLNQDSKLSIEEVMKAGITEQQKAQSIAIGANQLEKFRASQSAVMKARPEAMDAIIAIQERNSPSVRDANISEAGAAQAEYESEYGPVGETARKYRTKKQEVGADLMKRGYPFGYDVETGEATKEGLFLDNFQKTMALGPLMAPILALKERNKERAVLEEKAALERLPAVIYEEIAARERSIDSLKGGEGGRGTGKPKEHYAQGTNYVPDDQTARLHKGEAVIPAHLNPDNPSSGARRAESDAERNRRNEYLASLPPLPHRELDDYARNDLDITAKLNGVTSKSADVFRQKWGDTFAKPGDVTANDAMRNQRNEYLASLPPLPHRELDDYARNDLDITAKLNGVTSRSADEFRQKWNANFDKPEEAEPEEALAPLENGEAAVRYAQQGHFREQQRRPGQNANSRAWNRTGGGQSDADIWRRGARDGNANSKIWVDAALNGNANSRAWNGIDTSSEDSGYYNNPARRNDYEADDYESESNGSIGAYRTPHGAGTGVASSGGAPSKAEMDLQKTNSLLEKIEANTRPEVAPAPRGPQVVRNAGV